MFIGLGVDQIWFTWLGIFDDYNGLGFPTFWFNRSRV